MAENRSAGRDVHIYDANDPDIVLGGLILTNGVTNANFYSMVEVFLLFDSDYILRHEDGTELQRNDQPMRRGSYFVITDVRTISVASDTGVAEFRDAVRQRDRRCVITGERVVSARGSWAGFEAAHIFPSAYEDYWKEHNFGHWISIHPSTGGSINSVQNGLLLTADLHILFDSYDVSINPDIERISPGNILSLGIMSVGPLDQLLRWHFRQAVLANMRGSGEPVFEVDFPPGSDMMGEIMQGPTAAERMEFELFSRIAS
ncbi:HNH endonuclease-domain-containing protein [Tirmania nivea]|nr:HNH endonuclease-domain-containing protein [Tirmania nivea]